MKDLIKKQEEELENNINSSQNLGGLGIPICGYESARENLENFIKKVRKETAEAVVEKMIGEEIYATCGEEDDGYNKRIKEEKEIKKSIIKSL